MAEIISVFLLVGLFIALYYFFMSLAKTKALLDLIKDHKAQEDITRKAYHDKVQEITKTAGALIETTNNDIIPALLASHVFSGRLNTSKNDTAKATSSRLDGDQNPK